MLANEAVGQAPWQDLFERLIGEWGTRRRPAGEQVETGLPSAVYTDPRRYQQEVTKLFRRLPLCLGHADQLSTPGSVLAREILGLPLLLVHDKSGSLGVFMNTCRHRGAKLVSQDDVVCRRSSLSCLYHGWTYGLDGTLVSVPRRDAFPALNLATHGLKRLPSTVRHGLIWVTLDPAADAPPDMTAYLGALDADLGALGVGQHRFFRQNSVLRKANWKLIVDAFVEFYHIKRLHVSTIGQFFADSEAVADHVGPHQRMLVAREVFADVLDLPPERWSPQLHGSLVQFIFPNSLVVYHPDYISHMGIFPAGIDQTLFVHTVLTPELPKTEKARAHWERSFDLMDGKVFNDEDLFICEQIQLGLAGAANETFPLGRLEDNLRRFHATIEAMLRDDSA